ncbi:hypothetical protein Purlil1_6687 [Purpureocillium lilacinum]|uniref:Uncharacterized protein n=1 Tax=Purpureocillium lilacinum TaxID=33203 RepID=A0ABR0BXS3_PURLI|nr:hypothetical protein Purlil1_6687 [Purpureocillium lilacinum]
MTARTFRANLRRAAPERKNKGQGKGEEEWGGRPWPRPTSSPVTVFGVLATRRAEELSLIMAPATGLATAQAAGVTRTPSPGAGRPQGRSPGRDCTYHLPLATALAQFYTCMSYLPARRQRPRLGTLRRLQCARSCDSPKGHTRICPGTTICGKRDPADHVHAGRVEPGQAHGEGGGLICLAMRRDAACPWRSPNAGTLRAWANTLALASAQLLE